MYCIFVTETKTKTNIMTTETILSRIKQTEPTNRCELVNYFNCSYDMIEMHLNKLTYSKGESFIITLNNNTEIISNYIKH